VASQTLFQTPIYKTKIVPSDQEFNDLNDLLTNMFDASELGWAMETGKSTGNINLKLHWYPQMDWLKNAAAEHVAAYWQELNYRKDAEIGIEASWANRHLLNDRTGEHTHCGGAEQSHISAVYYFKKPSRSSNIEFVDPLEYIKRMVPIHHYSEHSSYTEVVADQFDLILFPSWLKHRTQPNPVNEERVAISINYVGFWQYN
jgi:uncharacterized protein (TIGR02466 family)